MTRRTSRRWALAFLDWLERALLNASTRERIHATATFALIFAFGATSVDFLIAGGGEFGAPARAAQPQAPAYASVNRTPSPAPESEAEAQIPTELAPTLTEATEVNVVAVSQSFEALALRSERTAPARMVEVSLPSEAPLAGQDEPVVRPQPRKAARDASGPKD